MDNPTDSGQKINSPDDPEIAWTWSGVFLYTVATICIALVIIRLIKALQKQKFRLTGVDVLQLLQQSKPFPIEACQGWRLLGLFYEHRLWKLKLNCDIIGQHTIDVYGCYSKVKASSQTVLSILKDTTKLPEWQTCWKNVRNLTLAQECHDTPSSKPKGSQNLPVQHDIISAQVSFIPNLVIQLVNQVSLWIQGEEFLKKTRPISRFWHKEEYNCCWLLEIDEEIQEWTFYLAQPVERWFEMDQCMLTVVSCPHPRRIHPANRETFAAFQLASLQSYILYRKVQCTPLTNVTLPFAPEPVPEEANPEETPAPASPPPKSNLVTASTKAKTLFEDFANFVRDERKSEGGFMHKMKNFVDEKKEWYEAKKKKAADKQGAETAKVEALASDILLHESKDPSNDSPRQACKMQVSKLKARDIQSDQSDKGTESDDEMEEDNELSDSFLKKRRNKQISRSLTITEPLNISEPGGMAASESSPSMGQKLKKKLWAELSRKSKSMDSKREEASDTKADDTKSKPEKLDEVKDAKEIEAAFEESCRKRANQVAAELLLEKNKVANIDISRPCEEQAEKTDGWIYCGLERDVVILRRIYEEGAQQQCYLGKGVIQCAPKTVFEALKNPRIRFTYDEMLKKIDILHDFGNGLKIAYLYHEVSQLFKRECRDFCILQQEKIEGCKYIIALTSIEWPGCPEEPDITRGKFHTSGWIVEPAVRDNKLHSMVTYVVQMELGYSKSNTGYLIEELAAKQPLSIAFLRQYLIPSTPMPRSSSAGSISSVSRRRFRGSLDDGALNGHSKNYSEQEEDNLAFKQIPC